MALYRYVKAYPKKPVRRPVIISFVLMALGASMLLWVAWPILSFSVLATPLFTKIISPVGDKTLSPIAYAAGGDIVGITTNADYTNANVWFPTKPQKKVVTPVNTYTMSIPKLKIHNAAVTIAGDDLSKSLVHYGGTGLPGEYGTAAVFGHSTLLYLYNPTDYKTIFSTLPSLGNGDEVFVTYDGVLYTYVVYDIEVAEPTDLSVLEQRYDDSYLTLITCVPPGTAWKRLHVKTRLKR